MPSLSRRNLALGAAALPLFAIRSRPADAAEFSYKLGDNVPAIHPLTLRAQEAADRIREASGGRLEIRVFPNNQLGSDTDMLGQLRSGALELFTLSGLILATFVPPASINGVGFAFKDYDQVWSAMDGRLGAFVRGEIAKRGIHPFEKIWDNGFRQTTSSTKPIVRPDDLRGFKIRVPVSPMWTSMFAALGASPASINFSEVYSALQTRIVDGQENPLTLIETAKLYEVQKYCSLTNHMWDGYWLLANQRAWDRLPKELQEIATRELNAGAERERADLLKMGQDVKSALQGKGLVFNDVDPAPFRERLRQAGFYKEWRGKYGEDAWKVLEESVGAIS
jgi:tripartite ATP-independent transporter DctP family solute receptor